MANEVYGSFEFAPKPFTRGSDVGRGQLGLPLLDAPLFLEVRNIKIHSHTGVDSQILRSEATPEMIKGFKYRERTERGVVTWTGSANTGSLNLTFDKQFQEPPTVMIIPTGENNALLCVSVGTPTISGVTIYWTDIDAATRTSIDFSYIIIGV